jgi:hypothetical protein
MWILWAADAPVCQRVRLVYEDVHQPQIIAPEYYYEYPAQRSHQRSPGGFVLWPERLGSCIIIQSPLNTSTPPRAQRRVGL